MLIGGWPQSYDFEAVAIFSFRAARVLEFKLRFCGVSYIIYGWGKRPNFSEKTIGARHSYKTLAFPLFLRPYYYLLASWSSPKVHPHYANLVLDLVPPRMVFRCFNFCILNLHQSNSVKTPRMVFPPPRGSLHRCPTINKTR